MTGPTLRERLRPFELVGFAAVLGVFAGVVALLATRETQLALILAGIAFIVALLVLAMLALAAGAPADPADQRPVLDRHDDERNGRQAPAADAQRSEPEPGPGTDRAPEAGGDD